MPDNESRLAELGNSISKYFSDSAHEKRFKKIESINSSIAFYDTVFKKYPVNFTLDEAFKACAESYWKELLPEYSVSDAAVRYGQVSGISDVRFIHDGVFYELCDSFFNNKEFSRKFDNKGYYPLLFHDVAQPRVIAMRLNNLWVDSNYRTIPFEAVLQKCSAEECFVMKYATGTCGGAGVKFFDSTDLSKLETALAGSKLDIVLQAVQTQCKELNEIHPSSLNTIRIMTWLSNTGAVVLSAVLRMGVNGSKVDNASSGGIVCGINAQGCTKELAFDKHGNCYTQHPSGTNFANIHIPGFEDCVNTSVMLQEKFPYCRMISWDWAISQSGTPVLIEANLSDGELDFHQFCNGPIFSDLTEQILKEVTEN